MKQKLIIGANKSFEYSDLEELVKLFGELYDVDLRLYGEMQAELLPPIVIFALGVITGVGTGFFQAIGTDLWKSVKKTAAKIVGKPRKEGITTLRFDYEYRLKKVTLNCRSDDPKVIEAAFDRLVKTLEEVEKHPDIVVQYIFNNDAKEWELE